jgi:two-component system chemotaxis response regulator CheV
MNTSQQTFREIDERTNLTGSNKFELLLFHLGEAAASKHRELFGINVFKVREILVMPTITKMANAPAHVMGVANIRGQIITVIDLASVVGCTPQKGAGILLVTEFARTIQAFAVEEVTEIVRLDWKQVLSAEGHGGGLVTSIARVDGDVENTRLAQVLDVERILQDVLPAQVKFEQDEKDSSHKVKLPAGTTVLAADDSPMARALIEKGLAALGVPFIMTKTGKEAWERLLSMADQADQAGHAVREKVALVLTDLEMPEMDGFSLTRNIKGDQRFNGIPVVIHSSLTGTTNEALVKNAGADAYVGKFAIEEMATTLRTVLARRP